MEVGARATHGRITYVWAAPCMHCDSGVCDYMYSCVCMCACVQECVYVCVHVRVCVCVRTFKLVFVNVSTHARALAHWLSSRNC